MKILLFSDSHRRVTPMEKAILAEKPDYVMHMGDLESDAHELRRIFPALSICSVPGNCDLVPLGKRYLFFELAGKKFFITHGHHFGVKMDLDGLINTALTAGADFCLFGHTHIPYYANVSGMTVINPGSAGTGSHTYGVLTVEGDTVRYVRKDC